MVPSLSIRAFERLLLFCLFQVLIVTMFRVNELHWLCSYLSSIFGQKRVTSVTQTTRCFKKARILRETRGPSSISFELTARLRVVM